MKSKKSFTVLLVLLALLLFVAGSAQASPYAKYAGTTLVITFPNIAYYNYAVQVIPEFTKETGIKVEIDKLDYMKMRDKQLLEMSKPKGDYDLISYVIMWKTEYVSKGLLSPLAPFFTNAALANPDYDGADLVPGYVHAIGTQGGRKGYLPGPTALFTEFLSGPKRACSPTARIFSTSTAGKSPRPTTNC